MISFENTKHVAHLAHLALSDDDIETMTGHLASVFSWMSSLNTLDNSAPITHETRTISPLRPDQKEIIPDVHQIMANVPAHHDGYIVVPSVLV